MGQHFSKRILILNGNSLPTAGAPATYPDQVAVPLTKPWYLVYGQNFEAVQGFIVVRTENAALDLKRLAQDRRKNRYDSSFTVA